MKLGSKPPFPEHMPDRENGHPGGFEDDLKITANLNWLNRRKSSPKRKKIRTSVRGK